MAREDPQLKVRLSIELKNQIEEAARKDGRTMNAEIVSRLEATFLPDINDAQLESMKHFMEAQDTEKELLRETGRHLQKIISAQDVNLIMLSTYLIDVINSLPKKIQGEDRIKAAAQFVLGLGEGTALPAQQGMLQLDTQRTVETVKAVVRGKTVDTGIVPSGGAVKKK